MEKEFKELADKIAEGFDLIDKRFEAIQNKIDKLDAIEAKIDKIQDGSNHTLSTIEQELKDGFANVIAELRKINGVTNYEAIHKNTPNIEA